MGLNNEKVEIIGLKNIPLIQQGDDVPQVIFESLKTMKISIQEGDILVIAQTIISKSKGRFRKLSEIIPSAEAIHLYEKIKPKAEKEGIPPKEPELIQAILEESNRIIKSEHVLITETHQGFICANAGIDKSNVGGEGRIILLPEDSDNEARSIQEDLENLTGVKVGIVVSDSFGRAFRVGATGVAIGVAGIDPILDKRGSKDLFGKELQSTIVAQADNLASAAQLVMGEADEGMPVVLIRGYHYDHSEKSSITSILRKQEIDLFRSQPKETLLKNFLTSRRSYKLDFAETVPDEDLVKQSIETARWAPNAHNSQCWRYILVSDEKKRNSLIDQMNTKLRVDLEKDCMTEGFIQGKINKTRRQFLQAPYLLLACLDANDLERYQDQERSEKEFILGIQSVSASLTYLLLALELNGLAACWYCAPLFAKEIICQELMLPKSHHPVAFVTIGYAIQEVKAPKRKPLDEVYKKI